MPKAIPDGKPQAVEPGMPNPIVKYKLWKTRAVRPEAPTLMPETLNPKPPHLNLTSW